jgi:hypothetical protein
VKLKIALASYVDADPDKDLHPEFWMPDPDPADPDPDPRLQNWHFSVEKYCE